MNFVNAFLLFTANSYVVGAVIPWITRKSVTKNVRPLWFESVFMVICGLMLYTAPIVDHVLLWIIYGVLSSIATVLSFLGYVQWNMLRYPTSHSHSSDAAQIGMALWDGAIAIVCFMQT